MKNKVISFLMYRKYRVNRKYKDRLFRLIFRDKKDLLSLYNAINHSHYTDPDDLIITTIEDAVYLGMKNDVSFLIGNTLNLYEHQSSYNPNMPLRGLFYFAEMLKSYVETNHFNIYGHGQVPLPVPQYIVFYNGTEGEIDIKELKLSDAFLPDDQTVYPPSLECRAIMLNINLGHNREIMENCKRLADYAYFVAAVRRYHTVNRTLEEAAALAIDECIEKDMLADVLAKNRAEVTNLLLTDYSERKYRKMLRKEAIEEGREEGRQMGREEGRQIGRQMGRQEGYVTGYESAIRDFIQGSQKNSLSEEAVLATLTGCFRLDHKTAQMYYDKYAPSDDKQH